MLEHVYVVSECFYMKTVFDSIFLHCIVFPNVFLVAVVVGLALYLGSWHVYIPDWHSKPQV